MQFLVSNNSTKSATLLRNPYKVKILMEIKNIK